MTLRLYIEALWVHFFNFDHLRNYTSKLRPHLRHKFRVPFLRLPPLIFSYLQALIHGFLWSWACSWLIFSLKWHLQSPLFLLHSVAMIFKKQRTPLMKKIQGLQTPHGATSFLLYFYLSYFHQPISFSSTKYSVNVVLK